MKSSPEILTELQEIAPKLAAAGQTRIPYAVPRVYFSEFAELLLLRIRFENESVSQTSGEEIREISPLLAGIGKTNPYHTPAGFFETLPVHIPVSSETPLRTIPQLKTDTGAKRIPLPMRIIRYAAAACIVALVGITVFNITFHAAVTDPIKELSAVSDQDMANYLDSDDIHWTPGVSSGTETVNSEFSDNDIHELLSTVPDAELEQYSNLFSKEKRSVN